MQKQKLEAEQAKQKEIDALQAQLAQLKEMTAGKQVRINITYRNLVVPVPYLDIYSLYTVYRDVESANLRPNCMETPTFMLPVLLLILNITLQIKQYIYLLSLEMFVLGIISNLKGPIRSILVVLFTS